MAKKINHSKDLINVEQSSSVSGNLKSLVANGNSKKPDFKRLPPSSLLSRVQGFLPSIACANDALVMQQNNVKGDTVNDMNIESVDENDEHVAMEIAFVDMSDKELSSSSDDSDSDEDSDNIGTIHLETKSITTENLKINKTMNEKFRTDMIKEIDSGVTN